MFFNFNCIVQDVSYVVSYVTIAAETMFGPNVQVYTATLPKDSCDRASGLEDGKSVEIGEDVWGVERCNLP